MSIGFFRRTTDGMATGPRATASIISLCFLILIGPVFGVACRCRESCDTDANTSQGFGARVGTRTRTALAVGSAVTPTTFSFAIRRTVTALASVSTAGT